MIAWGAKLKGAAQSEAHTPIPSAPELSFNAGAFIAHFIPIRVADEEALPVTMPLLWGLGTRHSFPSTQQGSIQEDAIHGC